MKTNLLILFITCSYSFMVSAQTFTEVLPKPPFADVQLGSTAFADVDGDNDQDVLITGFNGSSQISKLYINDGVGNFIEKLNIPFEGVSSSSIAFSDVDGDNDQDVLITGFGSSGARISKLYINDGMGNFAENTDTHFEGVTGSSIAFSDVDGDNDQDILITGIGSSGARISKLYINDGTGNFTENTGTPFEGIGGGSIAFSDVDGDNDQDVLITGLNGSLTQLSKLYINDGMGNFTENTDTPFEAVFASSVVFSDVDGDNDQDVLITGTTGSLVPISKLYTNDGMGNFTEIMNTPFESMDSGSIAFSDVDGDNDQDLIITGFGLLVPISKLYTNDGMGNFTERMDIPFDGVKFSSIALSDVDGDNDQDLIISGENNSEMPISKLYINDGVGNFTEKKGSSFEGIASSFIAFSDVDGDNDQDLLIIGSNNSSMPISKLYINDGMGNFTERMEPPFETISGGSIAFSDVDGDNDEDLIIAGINSLGVGISKLYTNDGIGNFTEIMDTPFEDVTSGFIAFSDVDGDNDQDVLITGMNNSFVPVSKLYINDGMGNFTENLNTSIEGVMGSSIAFSDVDGDNDQDLLITGRNTSFVPFSKLYTNDGMGNFTEIMDAPFEDVQFGSIAFSDVDGDNDQDVLITGLNSSGNSISKLYTNDGMGNFTEITGTPFEGLGFSSIAFSDVDGDNDQDVLITGQKSPSNSISKLYANDGMGNFTEITDTPFEGVASGFIAFSDVDGDNDQDVLITGRRSSGSRISKLYTNDGMITSVAEISSILRFEYILYPNPTQAQWVNLKIKSAENRSVNIKVFNPNGQLLSQRKEQISIGTQTFSIDIASLNKGSYFIHLDDGERKGVQILLIQ